MKKLIGYKLFAILYKLGCICPLQKDRYFCVMTHDSGKHSSVGVVIDAIKKQNADAKFVCLKKEDKRGSGIIDLFFRKPFQMARASTILMDNEFLPLACVKPRNGTQVVQLWHGTGTIKKFGHDISSGKMLDIVKKADSKITHLIVNSEYTKKLYAHCFGVSDDKVYITGIPRTDMLFDQKQLEDNKKGFYERFPMLKGKKLILYAPTFRDEEVNDPKMMLDLEEWKNAFGDDICLMLRLHPFVARAYSDTENTCPGVVNMSEYDDVNTLLSVADILITDYSSIIFEYIVFDRPLYFYAYDLERFENSDRGFYENYEEYVPGKVAKTTTELIDMIKEGDLSKEKRREFFDMAYSYKDGKSTARLLELLSNR